MSAALLQFLISAIETAVTQFPAFMADLKAIFAKDAPSAADFAALREKVASENYGQFVPASSLPPTE